MADAERNIFVAVIGVGLVGSELIQQLLSLPVTSPFRLISLSSSTRTIFDPANPIQVGSDWKSRLAASTTPADLRNFTHELQAFAKSAQKRIAIVDNTSSNAVAELYPTWLASGFNVVTPNKKAFSGTEALYQSILEGRFQGRSRFLNESTVGAGLPVISTLNDLLATGDKIIKIEGVLSGTMSYIFNEFSTGKPDGPAFSDVVSVARKKGYTEPHPADDLNGADVARKLTILSRTIASMSTTALPVLESYESVTTTSLIPPALEGIATGDEFIKRLPEFDPQFSKMRADASAEGTVLRFVGVVDVVNGQVRAGLERYPTTHPFATSLGGSDNIIMFHTERYSPRPLIIQGAGAGAAVTAMGVLGDLLKLVH